VTARPKRTGRAAGKTQPKRRRRRRRSFKCERCNRVTEILVPVEVTSLGPAGWMIAETKNWRVLVCALCARDVLRFLGQE